MRLKILLVTLTLAIVFSASVYANNYETPVCITVNDKYIKMEDKPVLHNGVTYVPVRLLSDVFGADSISWDTNTSQAVIVCSGKTVIITENDNIAVVDGENIEMNGEARITNGKLYVPIRFFTNVFGASLNWNQNYYRAEIEKNDITVSENFVTLKKYSDDELYWLAKIISCESSGETIEGKIGVGNVILNRVDNNDFPDSIFTVIFDKNHGVQFQPVSNGTIDNEPTGESYLAAKLVLEGEKTAGDSLFFLNPKIATNFWIPNNREYYISIGNHDFYL